MCERARTTRSRDVALGPGSNSSSSSVPPTSSCSSRYSIDTLLFPGLSHNGKQNDITANNSSHEKEQPESFLLEGIRNGRNPIDSPNANVSLVSGNRTDHLVEHAALFSGAGSGAIFQPTRGGKRGRDSSCPSETKAKRSRFTTSKVTSDSDRFLLPSEKVASTGSSCRGRKRGSGRTAFKTGNGSSNKIHLMKSASPSEKISRNGMYEKFQPWVLRTYGDAAKTKTITKKKYARIVKTLKGQEINNAENSKFRFWVKAKGFHIGPPAGHPHLRDDFLPFAAATAAMNHIDGEKEDEGWTRNEINGFDCLLKPELYVPTTVKDRSPKERPIYRRVAVVEQFFDIIFAVHVKTEARSGKHAGQKRTYRSITEKYAFLPREAVTKFLLNCVECQRRGSQGAVVGGPNASSQNDVNVQNVEVKQEPEVDKIENDKQHLSSGNKMVDDDEEDVDDDNSDADNFQNGHNFDPNRLKAFNMFVRLFVDENLDRKIPISKQPKEKIQAIVDSCRRQFPEFASRSRKRIRTYLKFCRRKTHWCHQDLGDSETISFKPAKLTSVEAEQILAKACKNESENATRLRLGLQPISQPLPSPISHNPPTRNGTTFTPDNSSHSFHDNESSARTSPNSISCGNGRTSSNFHFNNGNDLPLKRPYPEYYLWPTEVATVRQLISGYRESAAFLLRSADELELLLNSQK